MISRTNNAIKNFNIAIIFQVTNIVLKFLMRSVFIYCLGKEYLGVSGVFSNVLTVLSLAELGVGTAIVYDMYKPIAEKDNYLITQIMSFYKKIYFFIGIIIFAIGMCLLPFLSFLIKEVPRVHNLQLIYCLFLIQTCSSYFFAQYNSILSANQCNYIITRINIITSFFKTFLEIIALLIFKDYIVYLCIGIFLGIITNYIIYRKAYKMFPYIKEKAEPLEKKRVLRIFSNTVSMFSIRIGSTLVNATDNIIISGFVSTVLVGIYSNYGLIINTVLTLTVVIQQSILAGVGDLCVSNDKKKNVDIFEKIRFFYAGMYCVIFTCLYSLLTPFITLWLGSGYILENVIVFVLILNCYLSGIRQPVEMFIYADGLFKYFKFKPWIEAVCNIVISVILVNYLGLLGVFLGTTISHCLTTLWYDAYVVYKHSLGEKYINYWWKFILYFAITVLSIIITSKINNLSFFDSCFIGKLLVSLLVSSGLFTFAFWKTNYFQFYLKLVKKKIFHRR